jgi:hypothetical protein
VETPFASLSEAAGTSINQPIQDPVLPPLAGSKGIFGFGTKGIKSYKSQFRINEHDHRQVWLQTIASKTAQRRPRESAGRTIRVDA